MSDLFPNAPYQVTIDDMIEAAERELGLRRTVYPRRVADGKMSAGFASHQTLAMEAILELLKQRKAVGETAVRLARGGR